MDYKQEISPATVLHWNYRGFTEFPLNRIDGEESEVTDIYLKENLISQLPKEICRLENLESLYLSGNDITELPKEISHLRCLKCLDLSGNRLKRVPDEIGELRSLKFLIFDENELTELPLRLRELRALRYLSVCDNQLQWLPQRPVYNYHHCEFRFWRNTSLKAIPYSLWYHMFRDQQTRSLNIGCLGYTLFPQIAKNNKIRLKIVQDSKEWECDLNIPSQHDNVMETNKCSPPSLFELCRRLVYEIISDTARKQTSVIDETYPWRNFNNFDRIRSLQQTFEGINIDNDFNLDLNGNSTMKSINNVLNNKNRSYYVPTNIIDEHLRYLPQLIRKDICNGPISKCENVECKRPIFDYLFYEFCFGKLILIDNIADVLLSATFCCKSCAEVWKNGKVVIPWSLLGS